MTDKTPDMNEWRRMAAKIIRDNKNIFDGLVYR